MRIAQVITLFPPDFVGGATLACAAVARGLVDRGHHVEIFCGRPHGDAEPYAESTWEIDGIPVTGVNAAAGYDALAPCSYRHPEVVPAFARFLERTRPDVVHFHSIQALGADLLAVAAERGIPVVVTMHDWWWWCARLFLVDQHDFVCPPRVESARCHCAPGFDLVARRAHLTAMLAHADRVLTPSRFLADAAIANGVPAARVAVCANGVVAPGPRPRRRPGPIRFGYFGGPDHRMKGLPTLLAAADRMRCGGFELVLHVGAAERRGLARTLTDRVGTTVPIPLAIDDRVVVAPPFAPADLGKALGALDCLVVPSLMRESFSLVTREALAAGVPVIASDSGGPLEIVVPERNGLVFATGDADDLAACMRRFVLEPGLAAALADGAAATTIPRPASQLDQLEAVYADVRRERLAAAAAVPTSRAATADLDPVLFLAGCDGAPFRYRVTHLREALAGRGIASRALWWSDPTVPDAIAAARVVVVYRVPMSPWVEACLAYARGLGRPLVFSCDDLLFDAAATPHDALAALPENQRAWWLAATERYAATLRACDVFLATTEPLAAAAERMGVPAFVARNGIGARELAVAETLRKTLGATTARRRPDQPVVLSYFSGTTMHELDFALAAPALARVLRARPNARVRIGGHLLLPPALAKLEDRIERLPILPWHEMLAALATTDVHLAPLRDDAFSDAKSEVKWLEAAVLGIPTIASPTAAFRRVIRSGENGLLAGTRAEWERQLLAAVDDPGLRARLGNRARDGVFLHATPEAQVEAIIAALAAGAARARARDDRPGVGHERDAPCPPSPTAYPAEIGRYDLAPEYLLLGAAVEARDTPSGLLTDRWTVGQRFRATADGLCRVDVHVHTKKRGARLVVSLSEGQDPNDAPLRRVTVDATSAAGDAWIAASFDPIPDSGGRDFYLTVAADVGSASFTVWTYLHGHGDAPPGGLMFDHRPALGALTFRTFYADTPLDAPRAQ